MTHAEALELIREGVLSPAGVWADLGAGSGVFTRALAELLGEEGRVYAVDRDAGVLALESNRPGHARVLPQRADFTRSLALEDVDGILMANALHFVRDQQGVLSRLLSYLRPGGCFLLVEYDQEAGNPWVPYPISWKRFLTLAHLVGLRDVRQVGRRRSRFGHRELYTAVGVKGGS